MKNRRQFLASTGSALAATAMTSAQTARPPVCSIGLMADCQYADIQTAGARFYRNSPRKLKGAVEELNKHDLAFTLHLGDFIDRDLKSFEVLNPIVAKLKSPLHHALGNHDFDVEDEQKSEIPGLLGLAKGSYYVLGAPGVRILVLDTTEVSVYRHPKGSPQARAAHEELRKLEAARTPGAKSWNSRPSAKQLYWIDQQLQAATTKGDSVILFGHHPIMPNDGHSVWNSDPLNRLFQKYPCAKAYLNGHNHAGGYTEVKGFHYLTLDGMLNTEDQNAFAHAEVSPDYLKITGFGRQESHFLKFR